MKDKQLESSGWGLAVDKRYGGSLAWLSIIITITTIIIVIIITLNNHHYHHHRHHHWPKVWRIPCPPLPLPFSPLPQRPLHPSSHSTECLTRIVLTCFTFSQNQVWYAGMMFLLCDLQLSEGNSSWKRSPSRPHDTLTCPGWRFFVIWFEICCLICHDNEQYDPVEQIRENAINCILHLIAPSRGSPLR